MENWHEQKLSNLPFCRKLNSRSKPNPTSNPTSNPLIPMIHNLQKQIITGNSARRDGEEHLLDPLFPFNSTCSSSSRSLLRGGRSSRRRKQWRAAAKGKGEGRPSKGKRGGWWPRKGKKGGATTRVLWEKETTPQMSPGFASNGPQPFPHPRTEDQLLVNIFLGYYRRPQRLGLFQPFPSLNRSHKLVEASP
jgi:hypothetical protein